MQREINVYPGRNRSPLVEKEKPTVSHGSAFLRFWCRMDSLCGPRAHHVLLLGGGEGGLCMRLNTHIMEAGEEEDLLRSSNSLNTIWKLHPHHPLLFHSRQLDGYPDSSFRGFRVS